MANGLCPICRCILTFANATPSNFIRGAGRCNKCSNNYTRKRYKDNPLPFHRKNKKSRLQCRYGLTEEDYNKKYEQQNGVCAICKKPETILHNITKKVMSLSVDHSHITGKNRDLLCHVCNSQLVPVIEL